jgi:hypothetical protein
MKGARRSDYFRIAGNTLGKGNTNRVYRERVLILDKIVMPKLWKLNLADTLEQTTKT